MIIGITYKLPLKGDSIKSAPPTSKTQIKPEPVPEKINYEVFGEKYRESNN